MKDSDINYYLNEVGLCKDQSGHNELNNVLSEAFDRINELSNAIEKLQKDKAEKPLIFD